jgi:hypothetical protein
VRAPRPAGGWNRQVGLTMIRDGFYDVKYATMRGAGFARLRFECGTVSGETDRGTLLDGVCRYDSSRKTIQFEIAATVPPNNVSITGLTTGDTSRRVMFKGEAPAGDLNPRFSIDFAGRAVDITARYSGPL